MITNRITRNTFALGCGMSFLAFGFSTLSTTKLVMPDLKYARNKFSGEIKDISDIEDLEYTKGCKFYFYKKGTVNTNGIKAAREFKYSEDKTKLFKAVNGKIDQCTPNRYHYIDPDQATQ